MKYIILFPPLLLLIIITFLSGGICYLWGFKEAHFRLGASYINEKLFPGIIDKLFDEFK